MERFRLKRHLTAIPHDLDVVEIRAGVWNATSFTLTDETRSGVLYRLISRLDGSMTASEIARSEGVPRTDVESLIDHLAELDVIEDRASNALDHYLDQFLGASRTDDATAPRPILLAGDDDETVAETERILAAATPAGAVRRLDRSDETWKTVSANDDSWILDGGAFYSRLEGFRSWMDHLLVIQTTAINPVLLKNVNRVCLALGIPWMHSAPDGPFLLVGPIVVPNRSACYECLDTRVLMNLRGSASYVRYKEALLRSAVTLDLPSIDQPLRSLLASHTALEALNYSLTGYSFTLGKLLTVYLPTMEFSYNEVLRVPGCAACGQAAHAAEEQLYFDSRGLLELSDASAE